MARDRICLSDLERHGVEHVTIVCEPCGRRGRNAVARLLEQYGDLPLPDVLAKITADCDRRKSASVLATCRAVYAGLPKI